MNKKLIEAAAKAMAKAAGFVGWTSSPEHERSREHYRSLAKAALRVFEKSRPTSEGAECVIASCASLAVVRRRIVGQVPTGGYADFKHVPLCRTHGRAPKRAIDAARRQEKKR